jgi:hypothetical protein
MEVKLLENALKFLFEGQSLATIKKYVQKKMRRLEKGLVSPQGPTRDLKVVHAVMLRWQT